MGLRINLSPISLLAQRQLGLSTKALSRAVARLSSGKGINTASDDPAGLAISNSLETQRRALSRAILNINEAAGVLQTAEGAMQTQTQLVQRMRELSVQAANGALSANDRANINIEVQQLYDEFVRISTQTSFNGVKLLDGNFGTQNIQVGTQKDQTINSSINSMAAESVFKKTVGAGSIQTATSLSVGSAPTSMRMKDVNGDGILDLLDLDSTSDTISIQIGRGNGSFSSRTTFSVSSSASQFELADFNRDGKLDIVTMNTGTNTMSIFTNNGTGTFTLRSTITSADITALSNIGVTDLDGDGLDDVVAFGSDPSDGQTLAAYLSRGDGTFSNSATLNTVSFGSIAVGKIDSSRNGVIVGSGTYKLQNGAFSLVSAQPPNNQNIVASGDFNGDGRMDLVASDAIFLVGQNIVYSVLMNNGNGTYTATSSFTEGTSSLTTAVAMDYDNNGTDDLAYVYNSGLYLRSISSAGIISSTKVSLGSSTATTIAAGDVNGDGVLDLAGTINSGSTVALYLQNTTTASAVGSMNVSTQANAKTMLNIMDNALSYLSSSRASIGAQLNRLESALNNDQVQVENIAQSKSNILDVDYANEMAEMMKQQILQQVQTSVLSQANLQFQLVLGLLRPLD